MHDHCQKHKGVPPGSCFPGLTGILGLGAYGAAARTLHDNPIINVDNEKSIGTFLEGVNPVLPSFKKYAREVPPEMLAAMDQFSRMSEMILLSANALTVSWSKVMLVQPRIKTALRHEHFQFLEGLRSRLKKQNLRVRLLQTFFKRPPSSLPMESLAQAMTENMDHIPAVFLTEAITLQLSSLTAVRVELAKVQYKATPIVIVQPSVDVGISAPAVNETPTPKPKLG